MLPFFFFLILGLISVRSDVIDLNNGTDNILHMMNTFTKLLKETTTKIPAGSIKYENGSISYSEGTLVGLDSMVRTGDCVLKTDPETLSFDIHFGYSFFTAFFGTVNYEGEEFSASFRVLNNSLRLEFTVHNGTECHISLDGIHYERMSSVMLGSSKPEFDVVYSPKLETLFPEYVMPAMDKILNDDLASVEKMLQFICKLMPVNELFDLNDFKKLFIN